MPTRRDILLKGSAAIAATLAGNSCTLSVAPATRAHIDAIAHARSGRKPNPLIVIPGILGSRLVSVSGETVWGSYGPGSVRHGGSRRPPRTGSAHARRRGAHDHHLAELLPGTDRQDRLRIARDHLGKCLDSARDFQRALGCRCTLPDGVELHAFYGNSRKTIHSPRFTAEAHAETAVTLPGGGTVTARSALARDPDGTPGPISWTGTHPYHASHMTLPAQPDFIETLIETLVS